MEKEILVISDIHGRGDEFKLLIRRILKYIDRYKIILLGDYIGYGKNNIEVIRLLKYLKENADCVILKGNWEDMFYNYIKNKKSSDEFIQSTIESFVQRGGVKVANELFQNREALNYYLDLIENMEISHFEEINNKPYIFAHSGINLFKDNANYWSDLLEEQTEYDLIWNFNFYEDVLNLESMIEEMPYTIVAGHVPTSNVLKNGINKNIFNFKNKVIGVDFGASKTAGALGFANLSKPNIPCIYEDVIRSKKTSNKSPEYKKKDSSNKRNLSKETITKQNIMYILSNTINDQIFIGTRSKAMSKESLLEDIKKRSNSSNNLAKAIQLVGMDNIFIQEIREIPKLDNEEKKKLIGRTLLELGKKSMVEYQNEYIQLV